MKRYRLPGRKAHAMADFAETRRIRQACVDVKTQETGKIVKDSPRGCPGRRQMQPMITITTGAVDNVPRESAVASSGGVQPPPGRGLSLFFARVLI
ncbi:MAG: hypothetical protein ACYC3X_21045 [Pirellulaceae bacterium]